MKAGIEILFNKRKLLPYMLGALAFVCAGVFFLMIGIKAKNQFFLQLFLLFLGVVSTLFFGLILLNFLPRAFTRKAGIIITDEGLWDYSSGISGGFIAWGDIKKISHSYSGTNVFLLVMLKKPDKFIASQKGLFKRIVMSLNHKISGTPIHILVSILDTDINTLNNIIASKRFQKQ